MGMERVKDFSRKYFLPKEIVSRKTPLCPFYIQAEQQCDSMFKSAAEGSIEEGDLKPDVKVSCDQCQSSEPGFVSNNDGQVLSKTHDTYSAIKVDHTSDFVFNFVQTSTRSS